MTAYVIRRVLQVIPVFLGATLLIWAMVFLMPGDPIEAMFGDRPPPQATIDRLRAEYNLDQPFIVQYLSYLGGLLRLDFGVTFSGQDVLTVLERTFPVTLRLAALGVLLSGILSVVIGCASALTKGSFFDHSMLVIALVFVAIPVFVLCFLAQYIFGVQLGWFAPTVGANNDWGGLLLPALVLGFSLYASSMRLARASTIDTLNQDWVRTAYSKGLPRRRVIPVHVMRNSLIPMVTDLGTQFGVLMVGAVVTEAIFNIPGVGNTLYQAIVRGETPTVVSFVSVFVVVYVVINLAIDLLYGLLDPRIRYAR